MRSAKAPGRPSIVPDLDHPLELAAGHEAQHDRVDEAEEPVAADRQPEELGVLGAAADAQLAVGIDERERLHVGDEGRQRESAAMDVRREASAHRQAVGASLLLIERPLSRAGVLRRGEVFEQLRPLHAGLDLDQAASGVEREHPVQPAGVDQDAVGRELLSAHGVPPPSDAHGPPVPARELQRAAHCVDRLRVGDAVDPSRVELRMQVVDDDAFRLDLRQGSLRPHRGEAGHLQEFAAARHAPSSFSRRGASSSRARPGARKKLTL